MSWQKVKVLTSKQNAPKKRSPVFWKLSIVVSLFWLAPTQSPFRNLTKKKTSGPPSWAIQPTCQDLEIGSCLATWLKMDQGWTKGLRFGQLNLGFSPCFVSFSYLEKVPGPIGDIYELFAQFKAREEIWDNLEAPWRLLPLHQRKTEAVLTAEITAWHKCRKRQGRSGRRRAAAHL